MSYKLNDVKFQMKQQNILKNISKQNKPATPLAKTYAKTEMEGSVMYITNRRQTNTNKKFSILQKQFEVVGILGSGCYGQTYEVIDKMRCFKHFALKRTKTHFRQSLLEANTLLELDNPCIIPIFGCWQESSSLFVQTTLGNMSLAEILDNYVRVPENVFWAIAADISYALLECHEKKIIHLDVKPSNILVTELKYFLRSSYSNLLDNKVTKQQSKDELNFNTSPQREDQTPDLVNYSQINMRMSAMSRLSVQNLNAQDITNFESPDLNFKLYQDTEQNNQNEQQLMSHYSPEFVNTEKSIKINQKKQMHIKIPENLSTSRGEPNNLPKCDTVRYVAPLQRLKCKKLQDLDNLCVFQLIDFGLAQHQLQNNEFLQECTCGDSGYVDQRFMQTSKPDFSSDVFSFGLMLLEIVTGIQLPNSGPLFEKLRNNQYIDCFDREIFGNNLADYIQNDNVELDPDAKVKIDRDIWRAIQNLVDTDYNSRASIKQWREKYQEKLNVDSRNSAYLQINQMYYDLFNLSESQLENRCVVLSKEVIRQYREKKCNLHKNIVKKLVKSQFYSEKEFLKKQLPDIQSFIINGGKYFSKKKKSQFLKQSLRDTVTFLGKSNAQTELALSNNQYQNPLDFENYNLSNNESTRIKTSVQLKFNDLEDASPMFQCNQQENDNDFLLNDALDVDENYNRKSTQHIDYSGFFQEGVEAHEEKMNSFVHFSENDGPNQNEQNTIASMHHESTSEIPLVKLTNNDNKNQHVVYSEQELTEEKKQQPPPPASNFTLSEMVANSAEVYSSSQSSYSTDKKSLLQLHVKSHSNILNQVFSLVERLTGIYSMVYFHPSLQQITPTALKKNEDNDDFKQHQIQGAFRPKSGSYHQLLQSELQQNGFQTPQPLRYVDDIEKRKSNIILCKHFQANRATLFVLFCSFFLPIVYFLKLFRLLHFTKVTSTLVQISYALGTILTFLLMFILFQLNKMNFMEQADPIYNQVGNLSLYYDPTKLKRGIFGFLLPGGLYLVQWIVFYAQQGNVGLFFFVVAILEIVILFLLNRD